MSSQMQRAVDEACKGVLAGDGGPFGAAVVKDGQIISCCHNQVVKTNDPTAHAEINAIRAASAKLDTFILRGCDLYSSCYPCPMCMTACLWARVDRVFYCATPTEAAKAGFDDQAFYDFIRGKDNTRGMMAVECVPLDENNRNKPFDTWNAKQDKVPY